MMLLAESVAMPSLKISHKKKAQRSVKNHSPLTGSRKGLQGRVSSLPFRKNDIQKEMAAVLSKTEENHFVSNGMHMKRLLGGAKKKNVAPLLGKRKACQDAEVALQLHYKEIEGMASQGKLKDGRRTNNQNGHSGNVSKGCSVGSDINPLGKIEKFSNGSSTIEEHSQVKEEPTGVNREVASLVAPPPPKRLKCSGSGIKTEVKQENSHSTKQPSLVLKNIKKVKKIDRVGDVVQADNYVRRMASLNASACVSAMMQSDKRTFNKAIRTPEASLKTSSRQSISKSPSSAESVKESVFTFGEGPATGTAPCRSPTPSSCSSISSESQSLGYSSSDLEMSEPQLVETILTVLAHQSSNDDDVPYNRLGLLYNGDSVHPNARVFFNSDTDLTLPQKIIPKVFPSRDFFVKAATAQALLFRSAGKKKKAAKGNNGWMALGEPIKVIEYWKDGQNISRRFYAGIRRNGGKEVICVRDNIVVRAGGDEVGEKPYIAKIASIWRETAGQLMMTVFWYYRPDELDGATNQSSNFQKNELLASQHHDDNSVACIEDKCHILGVSQYCRYNAYVKAIMSGRKWNGGMMVPPVRSSPNIADFNGVAQNGSSSDSYPFLLQPNLGTNSLSKLMMGQGSYNFMEPDVQLFPTMDPGLVFLCYRGYNHCVGKLSSRAYK